MDKLRIVLADDHAVVREGMKTLISGQADMEVVGEAADGPSTVALVEALDPDIAVVDVSMPGFNGAEVTKKLKEARPGRKVLALTVHEDRGYLHLLMGAGASGYVLKRAAADELIRAIRTVADGGTYLDPVVTGSVVAGYIGHPNGQKADLSEREVEVVKFIAQGYSNKEIASQLELSVKTVETYKMRSLEKLGIRSRVGLVKYAAQQGWLNPL
jgi:DNA-binding NarL/FixJ family response regulator